MALIKKSVKEGFYRIFIGGYLFVISILLIYFVIKLWPLKVVINGKASTVNVLLLFGNIIEIGSEARLLFIVILLGALGSYVHAATSFVTYAGNRSIVMSWSWWYILRPFIGSAMAMIFYFVFRGGFFASNVSADDVSIYGMAGMSGLVGMFSKQATDKLRELFDNLFKTEKGDELRKDKLKEGIPAKDKMIPFRKIDAITIRDGQSEDDITIGELYDKLKGIITRIPVFDSQRIVKFVIHQSILFRYMADFSSGEGDARATLNVREKRLSDLLSVPRIKELVSETMAFIPENSSIGEAKREMEKTTNCQDVFLTMTGDPNEPVIGWLTNNDIAQSIDN